MKENLEPSPDQDFSTGTWQGRPAVFVAAKERREEGKTIIGIAFPVCVISDAVQHPEQVAELIADQMNRPEQGGAALHRFWKRIAEIGQAQVASLESRVIPEGPIYWSEEEVKRMSDAFRRSTPHITYGDMVRAVADEAVAILRDRNA